jgi:hypothetical protein
MNAAYQCTIFSFCSTIYNHNYYNTQNYNVTVYKIQGLTRLSVLLCGRENGHSPKNKNIGWTREIFEEPSLQRYDIVSLSESKKFSLDCPTLLMQALQFFEMPGTISPATQLHPQGLQSWATPWEPQILWGDLKLWDRRLSVTVVWMKMRVGLLGRKCSKGSNVSEKTVPPSSV